MGTGKPFSHFRPGIMTRFAVSEVTCRHAPTFTPVTGAGGVVVPNPGAPLPVEKTEVVRPPNRVCQMSAS